MFNSLNLYTVYSLDRHANTRGGDIIVYVNINLIRYACLYLLQMV